MAKRPETEPSAPPPPPDSTPPPGRRPRARRETAELTAVTQSRTRTAAFWGNRAPRAMSEAVTMIVPEPSPRSKGTDAPTNRRPSTAGDDFLEEVPTDVRTSE